MTGHVQAHRQRTRAQDKQEQEKPADLRNDELDEDVACCLAEIDEVLDAEKQERDQAEREFDEFDRDTSEKALRTWQAKYAHLGLSYGYCCGMRYLIDNSEDSKGS
jgi:hypothetical protein